MINCCCCWPLRRVSSTSYLSPWCTRPISDPMGSGVQLHFAGWLLRARCQLTFHRVPCPRSGSRCDCRYLCKPCNSIRLVIFRGLCRAFCSLSSCLHTLYHPEGTICHGRSADHSYAHPCTWSDLDLAICQCPSFYHSHTFLGNRIRSQKDSFRYRASGFAS